VKTLLTFKMEEPVCLSGIASPQPPDQLWGPPSLLSNE